MQKTFKVIFISLSFFSFAYEAHTAPRATETQKKENNKL